MLCCESTVDEHSAGNRHATFCGSRGRFAAPGDPVGGPGAAMADLIGHEAGNNGHSQETPKAHRDFLYSAR